MGDTSETNTKVLSRELFLGVVAIKTPIPQNHYLRDKVPFLELPKLTKLFVTGSKKRYIVAHIFKIGLLAPRGRVSSQL